jgi:hypothetical protein
MAIMQGRGCGNCRDKWRRCWSDVWRGFAAAGCASCCPRAATSGSSRPHSGLRDERIAEPVLLDERSASGEAERYAELYLKRRPEANPKIARRLAAKPLFHAGLMVAAGDADAMLAGVTVATARVIEAGMMTVGTLARRRNAVRASS